MAENNSSYIRMTVSIIVAKAKNNAIGKDNQLLWHISEDLKRFKALTMGHPIIMGRKTFESIGRPLPGRRNIVISRNFTREGVETASSVEDALARCQGEDEIFITGGGEIYRQTMDIADRLYITDVDCEPDGDTFFPEIDPGLWKEDAREDHEGYSFVNYTRRNNGND